MAGGVSVEVKRALMLVAASALCSCAVAQRPVVFSTQGTEGDATERVGRALAAAGHKPVFVDPAARRVEAAWEVLTPVNGQVQGFPGVLARRLVAEWTVGAQLELTVRMDVKRCVQGDAYVEGWELSGTCESVGDAMPQVLQAELERVGAQVKAGL